ncbi:MAG: response regulator transcription factor [Labilithrix sp.]|nr:response regulator transcription factor [Labilithrix sp.]MBX3220986.1 response regulator transcription factor [Labilithrix sp.]
MKLLVVEDNPKVASFLVRALTEEGHVVDQLGDGRSALEQIELVPYDAVLLDWMLPGLDGLSVCRAARDRGVRTPILILTARGEVGEKILGLDAGADDYLPKPFDLGELLARVRALGRRATASPTLRLGSLVIDPVARRVTVAGRAVELTTRELALLAYLVQHSGRAVSRSELLQKVWSTSFDRASNVVEVHVKNLREKLGEQETLIQTVRGVGYRAVAPTVES